MFDLTTIWFTNSGYNLPAGYWVVTAVLMVVVMTFEDRWVRLVLAGLVLVIPYAGYIVPVNLLGGFGTLPYWLAFIMPWGLPAFMVPAAIVVQGFYRRKSIANSIAKFWRGYMAERRGEEVIE